MYGTATLIGTHLFNQFVKWIVIAVVRADDAYSVAPHQHGHCGLNQSCKIRRESGFVDDNNTLLTAHV